MSYFFYTPLHDDFPPIFPPKQVIPLKFYHILYLNIIKEEIICLNCVIQISGYGST